MIQNIKNIIVEVLADLESCFNRASYFINTASSPKGELIFFLLSILVLFTLTLRSADEANFCFNLSKIIFVSIATFLVFCLSDTFWFLIKKAQIYKWNIKNKKNIKMLIEQIGNKKYPDIDREHIEVKILSIANFNTEGYKYHAKRNAVEVGFILLVLLFTFPSFFIYNIALFCGMFIYIFLYEEESFDHIYSDIAYLIYYIEILYRENPKNCKKFIIKNRNHKIRELRTIFNLISKV
ncbi:MAG: hypothetical protein KatS3mg035_2097 [Bacteroidia bacterium]|nr:MAG: hypothetical protein KatS3mg035_2097 [Bacteroidia bacterium]